MSSRRARAHPSSRLGQAILVPVRARRGSLPCIGRVFRRILLAEQRIAVDLADVLLGEETPFCETLDRCKEVSLFLLEQAPGWLAES